MNNANVKNFILKCKNNENFIIKKTALSTPCFVNGELKFVDGVSYRFSFPNGYGASVVKSSYSHGYDEDLWELAVLDSNGELCYDTSVTGDVEGYLTDREVNELLEQIKRL